MLHYREDVENVLLCEGGLVPVVEVVLFQQYLEEQKRQEEVTATTSWVLSKKRGERVSNSAYGFDQNISFITTWGQRFER